MPQRRRTPSCRALRQQARGIHRHREGLRAWGGCCPPCHSSTPKAREATREAAMWKRSRVMHSSTSLPGCLDSSGSTCSRKSSAAASLQGGHSAQPPRALRHLSTARRAGSGGPRRPAVTANTPHACQRAAAESFAPCCRQQRCAGGCTLTCALSCRACSRCLCPGSAARGAGPPHACLHPALPPAPCPHLSASTLPSSSVPRSSASWESSQKRGRYSRACSA